MNEAGSVLSNVFRRMAQAVSLHSGSPWAAMAALLLVVIWLASGPFFDYSDHWQLIISARA